MTTIYSLKAQAFGRAYLFAMRMRSNNRRKWKKIRQQFLDGVNWEANNSEQKDGKEEKIEIEIIPII